MITCANDTLDHIYLCTKGRYGADLGFYEVDQKWVKWLHVLNRSSQFLLVQGALLDVSCERYRLYFTTTIDDMNGKKRKNNDDITWQYLDNIYGIFIWIGLGCGSNYCVQIF